MLLVISATLFANAAPAKNIKYGKWLMHCSDVSAPEKINATSNEEPTKKACALFQSVAAKSRPRFGLTILISKDDGSTTNTNSNQNTEKPAAMIKMLVPLGILIPTGIGMEIDGRNLGLTGFLRCLPNGCTAVATLTQVLLDDLKSAKLASFTIFLTPEDGLSIPVELDGLSAGFAALDQ